MKIGLSLALTMSGIIAHDVEGAIGLEPVLDGGCFSLEDRRVRIATHKKIHGWIYERQESPVHSKRLGPQLPLG